VFHNIKAKILAIFNHCLGMKINNQIIKVNILIVIVKELDSAMFWLAIADFRLEKKYSRLPTVYI